MVRPSRSHGGFTLVEVMTAVAIFGIVVVILYTILLAYSFTGRQTSENVETLSKLNQIIGLMREITSRAVDVHITGSPLDGFSSIAGEGYVRTFNYDSFDDLLTPTTPLMFFARETQTNRTAPARLVPTAVFFRAPVPSAPGSVIFDLGGDFTEGVLRPSTDDHEIDGIIAIRLGAPQFHPVSTSLFRIELTVTMRVFIASPTGKINQWCPPGNSCTVGKMLSYRDLSKSVILNFGNNRRASVAPSLEYPYGFYFLKTSYVR